ncbi:MAG: fatty acid desaturase [Halothiobacillaceae bacterium]|nr:MAG: fatty acid desaturase [Halothiobacillaceae bacterium]
MEIVILFIVQWYIAVFMQSFYLHRFAAHGMIEMSRFWSRFFYLVTTVVQGPSFLNPRAYAILHTLHHGYSDTAQDPHSPHYHRNAVTMVWKTFQIYTDIRKRRIHTQFPIKRPCVDWPFFEALNHTRLLRILLLGGYFALYWNWASSPWLWLLIAQHPPPRSSYLRRTLPEQPPQIPQRYQLRSARR